MNKRTIISTAIEANPITTSVYESLLDEQILKILFEDGPCSADSVQKALERSKIYVNSDKITNAVKRLKISHYIPQECKGTSLYLNPMGSKIVQQKKDKYKNTISSIIKRYFSEGIELKHNVIEMWLEKILLAIFQQYYHIVLSRVTNEEKIDVELLNIDNLHKSIIKEFSIDNDDSLILREQLKEMLTAENDPDVPYLHSYYLNSCYASQVLSSKTYSPISVAEVFANKTIILDTNVLIALQLERINQRHVRFSVIDDVCKKLNAKLKYIPQTAGEYSRVITYKKKEYSDLFSGFEQNVLDSSRYDNIYHTLKINGCYTSDSVEKLFDTHLISTPTELGNQMTAIEQVPKEESYESFEYYKKIDEDKTSLRKIFSLVDIEDIEQDEDDFLPSGKIVIKKKDGVVEHDLGLIGYVRTLRGEGEIASKHKIAANDDVILLTMDNSIISYARDKYPDENFVYSLRDLVTLLSLDKGGLMGTPEDFVPMLSSFVNNHFIIWEDTFNIQDLAIVMRLEREVASLGDVKAIQIAKEVHRMRMKNTSKNDIHKYLNATLNFEFNKVNSENIKLVDKTNEQKRELEEKDSLLRKKDETIESLKEEGRKQRQRDFDKAFDEESYNRNRWHRIDKTIFVVGIVAFAFCCICIILHFLRECDCVMKWFNEQGRYVQYIINNPFVKMEDSTTKIIGYVSAAFTIFGIGDKIRRKRDGFYTEPAITKAVLEKMGINKDKDDYIQNGL